MGGDEFVVLAPDVEPEALEENCQRFRAAVERTGILLGYSGLSSSIGAVAFGPTEGDVDADTILAAADRRMYANKTRRRAQGFNSPENTMVRLPVRRLEVFADKSDAAISVN
jgi:GGDEF domain-containing protein